MLEGKKVVLAYSGGLDTSVCVKWLEQQGAEPYALYLDLGQGEPSEDVKAKALEIGATVRDWNMSRPGEMAYAEEHGIPVPTTKEAPYSVDENLWGRSIEAGPLEDPDHEPTEDVFELTTSPENAPDEPQYVEIGFEEGLPTSLDGEKLPLVDLIAELGAVAGANGVGRIDMVEDRLVGIKSREIYESPAALAMIPA